MIIKYFAYIRDYTRKKEESFEKCDTVEELLKKLCSIYGRKFEQKVFNENGELGAEIIILVNGRHITHYDGIHTKLNQDDEISIFPVVAGG